jgi:uncharacterized protein YggL (DUF469 family)
MGLAARILEQEPTGKFRHMIHDEVDKWVDQIIDEVFEEGKEAKVGGRRPKGSVYICWARIE